MQTYDEFTDTQKELWLYMVNDYYIHEDYHKLTMQAVENRRTLPTSGECSKMGRIVEKAISQYRRTIGNLGRIGCRQAYRVGYYILVSDIREAIDFKAHNDPNPDTRDLYNSLLTSIRMEEANNKKNK